MRQGLLLALVLLSSCSHYSEEELVGAFVYRRHMGRDLLRWEGGNTFGRYHELCNTITNECFFRDVDGPAWVRGLWFAPYYSRSKELVVIYTNNTNRRKTANEELRLFHTANGHEIKCENCDIETAPRGDVASMYRHTETRFVFSTVDKLGKTQLDSVWLIELQNNSYTIRKIKEITSTAGARFHGAIQMSPQGNLLAWIVCDPDCVLVESDLITGEEGAQSANCPNGGYSTIEWIEAKAIPKCG